ncbi:Low-density lipoprotein receptor repeat class B [Oesophagostomum dentatum]|uniref:Low-density lipoprotein receptor repeat class B n=1 Tax=Oesophagostomum dentatum TaxID=61180 RepID=A0A0B1SBG1_OESDE|nr:Low-density lipoprotein receptor repeat class B [Oesophagostomum dentatum]
MKRKRERRIYYADVGSNSIERLNLDGTFPHVVQKYEVDGLEGIAVDWIGRNLYTLRRNDIIVQNLDGHYRRSLYKGVMRLPRAIALHPAKGMMFVSDWSSYAFIAAASMDGSSFTKIISERITWPNALAVDIYSDKIYWADAYNDVIE